ncbi:MAG TPA: hypothetical protein VHH15_18405 [Actinophytocola sp.]|nr:hypothetical protein [Actinophytocola sp.]
MTALGTTTRKATVQAALERAVGRHRTRRVLELRGNVEWTGDLDDMRRGRTFPTAAPTVDVQ